MTLHKLRLILTRHAKSAWDDPAVDDHDRVLNARGQRQARELGDWIASRGYDPEEVLCSSAKRTRETWAAIEGAVLTTRPEVHILPKLYAADPAQLLSVLAGAHMPVVQIIAHSPGIGALAAMLVANPPADADFARYPTSATTIIDFQASGWSALQAGSGDCRDFFVPRD